MNNARQDIKKTIKRNLKCFLHYTSNTLRFFPQKIPNLVASIE